MFGRRPKWVFNLFGCKLLVNLFWACPLTDWVSFKTTVSSRITKLFFYLFGISSGTSRAETFRDFAVAIPFFLPEMGVSTNTSALLPRWCRYFMPSTARGTVREKVYAPRWQHPIEKTVGGRIDTEVNICTNYMYTIYVIIHKYAHVCESLWKHGCIYMHM
jgi:hypothetical protein